MLQKFSQTLPRKNTIMSISLGVRRSLQQCAQPNGVFAMVAMDQRGSLRRAMAADDPDAVAFAQMAASSHELEGWYQA